MLDSIYIGMTGLVGYSRGLRVIANNAANINTPGFKGSSMQFGDLFYTSGPASGGAASARPDPLGQGLATYAPTLDFSQGELRQSGNDLDLAVDGQGLFMLKDGSGKIVYTRDGQFTFDDDGFLVSRTNGWRVLGHDAHGALVEIGLDGHRTHPAKATATLEFRGNLSSTEDTHTLTDVKVLDAAGAEHVLRLQFNNESDTVPGDWTVTLMEGSTEVGRGTLHFIGGILDSAQSKLQMTYRPKGQPEIPLTLDFGADTTSSAQGSQSTLELIGQDGYASGALTATTFDERGVLQLAYSNGQKIEGSKIALARFDSLESVVSAGDNTFEALDPSRWQTGSARSGAFGAIRSGVVEISNVDLSSEFSDLVIMQRGYQASSQIISTANDMIQELFSIKGR